jgi:hypothetical protein
MFALLSSLDVHERVGSWRQSRPKGVFYTLASSKFVENFATLNVALVAECVSTCVLTCDLICDLTYDSVPAFIS